MIFFLGASIGSFSLVIVRRGHNNDWKSWLTGKSICESCKKELKWWELIPFFSFLFLRGECSKCKAKIDPSHFFCETFAGIAYVAIFLGYSYQYFSVQEAIFFAVVHSFFIALSSSDFLYREINVIPVYILAAIGLTYNAVFYQQYILIPIVVVLFIVLGIICSKDSFRLFGSGDVDVVICILALLGNCFGLIDVILYASCAGIVLFFVVYGRRDESIPFVPCLYFGYILSSLDISIYKAISDLFQRILSM